METTKNSPQITLAEECKKLISQLDGKGYKEGFEITSKLNYLLNGEGVESIKGAENQYDDEILRLPSGEYIHHWRSEISEGVLQDGFSIETVESAKNIIDDELKYLENQQKKLEETKQKLIHIKDEIK